MTYLDVFGLIATGFTTASFIPQAWQIWRTRDVSAISLSSYSILSIGLVLWLIYGFVKQDIPLIVANSVMVCLTLSITVMKLIFSSKTK